MNSTLLYGRDNQRYLTSSSRSERKAMKSALLVLALAFCFTVDASRSPAALINFIATIVLAVIAVEVTVCAVARPRTKPGLVSSPPVPPSSSSSSSYLSSIFTSSCTNPQVFLSSRGPDTCKGLADSLYTRLNDDGIRAVRDDEDIGEGITDASLEFIKQCRISIPIISKNYILQGLVSSPPVPPSSSLSSSLFISTPSRANYEVFLSFRGPDTRKGFTDYLYIRLTDVGIYAFRDNEEIHLGEEIKDTFLQSIKQSKISIPIISRNYPSSRSCLRELAQMLECKKANNQLIMPIFYDISRTELKVQQGFIEQCFREHEEHGVSDTDIAKWKRALRKIAGMKGYDLLTRNNGCQGALIEEVVRYIKQLLKKNDLYVPDGLVDIEPPIQEVMRKLGVVYVNKKATGVDDKDVRVLGICGMPGVGKTTVGKIVYNKIHHLFQRCSFLSDITTTVQSNGVEGLLEKLISDLRMKNYGGLSTHHQCIEVSKMKVLILLDDVQDFDHIRQLVGKISCFGPGSRILMTIRSKDVLRKYGHGVADTYEVEPMGPNHALQLFHKHAFCEYPPEEERNDYYHLAKDIVNNFEGLPLSIKETASCLNNSRWNIEIWRETSDFSRKKLESKVKSVFKAIYDSLDECTKKIFLDIASIYHGKDRKMPTSKWQANGYYPLRSIKILIDTCLIKIGENNKFWMHNQLRKYGEEIVGMKNFEKP